MKFKTLTGKESNINIRKYLVDWDADEKSKFQTKCKNFFKPYWQYNVVCSEFRLVGTRLTIDLFNVTKNIMVEQQGRQHTEYNKFFHRGSRANYLGQIKRDQKKIDWANANNILLIEIFEDEIDKLSEDFFLEKYNISL